MIRLDLFTFLKPKNELEGSNESNSSMPFVPDSMWVKCPACNNMLLASDLKENFSVCSKCNHHFRMTARERIKIVADKDTFIEMDKDMESTDILNFPNYKEKLKVAKEKSNEKENLSDKELLVKIKSVDKNRRAFMGLISNSEWGNKENYDLCINTSNIKIKNIIVPLSEYIKTYMGGK